jgi:hypothetical protein
MMGVMAPLSGEEGASRWLENGPISWGLATGEFTAYRACRLHPSERLLRLSIAQGQILIGLAYGKQRL